jgi:hypothetical protein
VFSPSFILILFSHVRLDQSRPKYLSAYPTTFLCTSRHLVCLASLFQMVSDEQYGLWSFRSDGIMQCFWRLVAGLSPWKPGLDPGPVHVGFVVERMTLEQGYPRVLRVSAVSMVPVMPHSHISFVYHRRYIILAIVSVVKLKYFSQSAPNFM